VRRQDAIGFPAHRTSVLCSTRAGASYAAFVGHRGMPAVKKLFDGAVTVIIKAYADERLGFVTRHERQRQRDPIMSLTSSRMRAVNAVFEAGSFSQAARRLGISQPAITQQVRSLENQFAVTLFERRSNKLLPTGLCREFVAVTSQLHGLEAQALAVLRHKDALQGGELRIGLGNSMPGMALISAFHRLYANVQISVEMGNWASIIDAVVDQRVDVGVLPDVPNDSRFRREVCLRQSVVAIVHPSHPLARARKVSCVELGRQRLVFRTKQSSTQRVVDRAFRAAGIKPKPEIVLDARDGVFEAVANELGVGFTWEYGSSRADKIVKVHVPEMAAQVPEHIFCLANKRYKLVELFFETPKAIKHMTT
jgi:DNA-binding transcriptional LysR family regulator